MKKIIFTLLIAFNIFAMSETPTNQNKNSLCMDRTFFENQSEIDKMLAQEKETVHIQKPKEIRR